MISSKDSVAGISGEMKEMFGETCHLRRSEFGNGAAVPLRCHIELTNERETYCATSILSTIL